MAKVFSLWSVVSVIVIGIAFFDGHNLETWEKCAVIVNSGMWFTAKMWSIIYEVVKFSNGQNK